MPLHLLPLSYVLHVPKFSTNLLSISRITSDLKCSVTFFPTHCIFQDLHTKQTIGSGKVEMASIVYCLMKPVERVCLEVLTVLRLIHFLERLGCGISD